MSKVGDMNDDGYEGKNDGKVMAEHSPKPWDLTTNLLLLLIISDVAIGAPYEDDGAGAVYIYMGSAAGLNPNYAQKIQVAGTKGFGISISKGLDIDNNQRNGNNHIFNDSDWINFSVNTAIEELIYFLPKTFNCAINNW